jgi:hypothetical protein
LWAAGSDGKANPIANTPVASAKKPIDTYVLPNGQRRYEPRDGIEPRAEDSQQPALARAERPNHQAIAWQNAQRIGTQRNKQDQADEGAEFNEDLGISHEKECHAN